MPNIVCGQVNADATIAYGKGFTVQHNNTGYFTISFNPVFKSPPVITVTANAKEYGTKSWSICGIGTSNVTASSFEVLILDINTRLYADADFSFIATSSDASDQ